MDDDCFCRAAPGLAPVANYAQFDLNKDNMNIIRQELSYNLAQCPVSSYYFGRKHKAP